jgi:ribosomal-protein-alanine N-acetyltransferase
MRQPRQMKKAAPLNDGRGAPAVVTGERLTLRSLEPGDAAAMLALYERNATFLQPWDPARPPGFYTLSFQEDIIRTAQTAAANDRGYMFGIVLNETGALVGRLTLSGIVRGAFQNAYLGYWLDEGCTGRGLMTEAVGLALRHGFQVLRLHRIQAATLPHNHASRRVLEKNGFRREGLAQRYLLIDGQWQDHVLFALTVEEWEERRGSR